MKNKYNPEKRRKRYLENIERDRKNALDYYYKNKDKQNSKNKEYYQKNIEALRRKNRERNRKRRAEMKLGQNNTHVLQCETKDGQNDTKAAKTYLKTVSK